MTAAYMNGIRDTLLETAAAKVTTAGDLVYATGANALARLGSGGASGLVLGLVAGLPVWGSIAVKRARAYLTTATTATTTSVPLAVPFNAESYDTDAFHDNVTNNTRMTMPVAGLVLLTASVYWETASATPRTLYVYKNGSPIRNFVLNNTVTGTSSQHVTTQDVCAAGDYYEIYVMQTSGGSMNIVGGTSPFTFVEVALLWP